MSFDILPVTERPGTYMGRCVIRVMSPISPSSSFNLWWHMIISISFESLSYILAIVAAPVSAFYHLSGMYLPCYCVIILYLRKRLP
ncbi:hypothetical protein EDD17DRAFT_1616555 [Pisolithus thermaeus]|nr:hypothetical protein EDD17DRAFT_1616555 [Pisolithus thermaeus]